MTRLEELELEIDSLPAEEHRELCRWLLERDWEKWDRQKAQKDACALHR